MNTKALPHILIIGAGFGGMEVARRLAKTPVEITLVDKHNYHLFQPLLYQVAIAGLLPSQIAYPVRTIFRRQKNLTFQMGEVTEINLQARYVKMNGSVIAYDILVFAAGGETNFFGNHSVEQNGFQIKGIESAIAVRNHLLKTFEEASREADAQKRKALLTFVVVGGGPTGVETAGALAELIIHVLSRDYPHMDLKEVRVILLEAGNTVMPSYPDELRKATIDLLKSKKVEVLTNSKLVDYNGQCVTLGDGAPSGAQTPVLAPHLSLTGRCQGGASVEANTLIWTAGVKAAGIANRLGVEQAGSGRVRVADSLQIPDHPEVFVVGDAAYVVNGNGQPLPMLSTVAIQQGKVAARNIQRIIRGEMPEAFHYKDPGLLATIGRNAAVARIWGLSFSGFIAWLIWVFLHVYRLIGFRNRLLVLINWAWEYFFYENQVRLITRE
ncbi:MAG TPA: NAD(P)/FAD-dependent oxidoreductase [Anaerolineales bacterium]|nr:NAD(P)/FAD-dependent oxidoreductase [Anaerolineales bacterium]